MKLARSLPLMIFLAALTAGAQQASPVGVSASGRISGTILQRSTGQPLPGIEVSISPTEHRDTATQVVTGPDGRFLFKGVDRGKYSLTAQGRGFSLQAYQQHGQYSTAIAVGPGLDSENLIFQLLPDASISGMVLDEENEPVRSGEVLLFTRTAAGGPTKALLHSRAGLDEQGRYHFGHLQPGSYAVAVIAQPWYAQDPPGNSTTERLSVDADELSNPEATNVAPNAPESTPLDVTYRITYYADATDPDNATAIVLHPGERAMADVTLRAVPALHVNVRNLGTGRNQPGTAIVMQRLFDGAPVAVQTRGQQIAPSTVRISGVPPGHLILNLRSFTGNSWRSETREVEVAADTEIDASEQISGSVNVRGVVRLPGDAAIPPGLHLRFYNRATGVNVAAQVSAKGEFEAQPTLPGPATYEVAAISLPNSAMQNMVATGARVVGRTLLVPRNGTVQLTITMSKVLARVDGTVLRGEKPVSQSMILLVPQSLEGNLDLFRRDQSDSDGTFSLYRVLPGKYVVVAIENGWDLDWQNPAVLKPFLEHGQSLEVTTGQTYKISLTLQDSATQATAPGQP
jgi:carboxypeptidase family protein